MTKTENLKTCKLSSLKTVGFLNAKNIKASRCTTIIILGTSRFQIQNISKVQKVATRKLSKKFILDAQFYKINIVCTSAFICFLIFFKVFPQ